MTEDKGATVVLEDDLKYFNYNTLGYTNETCKCNFCLTLQTNL